MFSCLPNSLNHLRDKRFVDDTGREWFWCFACDVASLICSKCGVNLCGGGSNEVNGEICSCDEDYEYYKRISAPSQLDIFGKEDFEKFQDYKFDLIKKIETSIEELYYIGGDRWRLLDLFSKNDHIKYDEYSKNNLFYI